MYVGMEVCKEAWRYPNGVRGVLAFVRAHVRSEDLRVLRSPFFLLGVGRVGLRFLGLDATG